MNELLVHFEVKGERAGSLQKYIDRKHFIFNTDSKAAAEVPTDWEGFRNGTIRDILRFFNEDVYIGIAFITENPNYIVTDFNGEPVPPFEDVVDGRKVYRYVKKRLSVLNIVNPEEDSFEVKRYMMNLKFVNPLITVLDLYSIGALSGVSSSQFKLN